MKKRTRMVKDWNSSSYLSGHILVITFMLLGSVLVVMAGDDTSPETKEKGQYINPGGNRDPISYQEIREPVTFVDENWEEKVARAWENYSDVETTDDWQFTPDNHEYGYSNSGGGSYGYGGGNTMNSGGSVYLSSPGPSAYAKIGSQGATASESLGFSVGGAKDVNNFRENINNDYLPLPTDMTYEGLFYEYYFDTGIEEMGTDALFYPSYSSAVTRDPISGEEEYYLSVGLKSGMKQEDFSRKDLNIVVVLDISGSMSSSFDRYYYDQFGRQIELDGEAMNKSKMEVATESVVALLDHLYPTDRFGMVLFESGAYVGRPLNYMYETDMDTLKEHILNITPQGGTNMGSGMHLATTLFENFTSVDKSQFENRIIFLTDAMPNLGVTNRHGLHGMMERNAENSTYTTFIGIGVDFNSELTEHITKVKGANYYSVHYPEEFMDRMDEGFDYMVTPLVFDLNLVLNAPGYEIEAVYGSPEANQSTGELMRVNTLFPSPTVGGETKGGIVLLKLKKVAPISEMVLIAGYENREGVVFAHEKVFSMPTVQPDHFGNDGIRKGILLTRYADLMQNWLIDEREAHEENTYVRPTIDDDTGIIAPPTLGEWERQSMPLTVCDEYQEYFEEFADHLLEEHDAIGDDTLLREYNLLIKLSDL